MAPKLQIFGYHCDYFSDRLCRIYTTLIFIVIALYLKYELCRENGIITCWTPAQFTSSHVKYTNDHCKGGASEWFVPFEDSVPRIDSYEQKVRVPVKRWEHLPALLFLQGLLFCLPWLLWRFVSGACCSLEASVRDSAQITSNQLLQRTCELQKLAESKVLSIVFCFTYLVIKFLYGTLCLVQMAILSYNFGINFFRYGSYQNSSFEKNGTNFGLDQIFPKVVLCSYEIRHLARVHSYVVQCTVPVSDVISQCLYYIWAWLIILFVITTLSGMISLVQMLLWFIGLNSTELVQRKLQHVESFKMADKKIISKFVKLYITPGLYLALDIIEENGCILGVENALEGMWNKFAADTKVVDAVAQSAVIKENVEAMNPLLAPVPQDCGAYSTPRKQLTDAETEFNKI